MVGRGRSDSGIETPQSRRKYLLCVCDILIQFARARAGRILPDYSWSREADPSNVTQMAQHNTGAWERDTLY